MNADNRSNEQESSSVLTGDDFTVHFFDLDILRFLAVSMVVIYHGYGAYAGWFHIPSFMTNNGTLTTFGDHMERFFLNMSSGVDLFFLISGFLITYLLLTEKKRNGRINVRNFYIRRTLRIWPLYFFIILIAPLLVKIAGTPSPSYIGTVFFMNNFQAIATGHMEYPFVHFWTLSVEEHYYLLIPLLIALLPVRKLPAHFLILVTAALVYRFCAFFLEKDCFHDIELNTLTRGDSIAIGAFIAYRHSVRPITFRMNRILRAFLLLFFLSGFFLLTGYAPQGLFQLVFINYFFTTGFIILLLNTLFSTAPLLTGQRKTFLHYLGRISYGIYVYHNILIPIIVRKVMYPAGTDSPLLFWTIYVSSTLLLAVLSYEFFEKRILRYKERFAVVRTER